MTRPLKFHQSLNQPARNARHGKHRPARTSPHRHPADRASDGAGGTIAVGPLQITWDQSRRYAHFTDTSQDSGESSGLIWGTLKPGNWVSFFDLYPDLFKPLPSVVTTGELIGHRLWWLINGHLYSLAHEQHWEPGEVMEGDVDSEIRDTGVEGGVYSYNDAERCRNEGTQFGRMLDRMSYHWSLWSSSLTERHAYIRNADAVICGTVKLWGQVVEHEDGYRAQFARIASLDSIHAPPYLSDAAPEWLEMLRRKYGV